MTRKDYETLAACIGDALKYSRSDAETKGILEVKRRIELELSLDNPKFNVGTFVAAISKAAGY